MLGVTQNPDQDPVEQVALALKEKTILLLLDNFEQVIGAYEVVVSWLKRCSGARFLITSREPLNVRGEHGFHLSPMSLPAPGVGGVLSQFEATRLFIDRACAGNPDFTVDNVNAPIVAEICSRLDGIPLAIELICSMKTSVPYTAGSRCFAADFPWNRPYPYWNRSAVESLTYLKG